MKKQTQFRAYRHVLLRLPHPGCPVTHFPPFMAAHGRPHAIPRKLQIIESETEK
jgi:hypothetical protein